MAPFAGRALLLLAAAAVAAGASESPGRRYYDEEPLTPFFRRIDALGVRVAVRPGSDWALFPVRKRPATLRVFVVGGSIASRYMGGSDGLRAALRLALPSLRVEALNCGMAAYDTTRESLIVDEVLAYEPDLIVLMTGHNERPGELARVEEAFERNLGGMIGRARGRGVPIMVVVPPLNKRGAPARGEPDLSMPEAARAWIAQLRGDQERALEGWRAALRRSEPRASQARSIALFYRARAYEALGRQAEANRDYEAAVDADTDWTLSGRCVGRCLAAIRRVGAREGAVIADLDAAFARRAAPALPGFELFQDGVHWSHAADGLASEAILDALRRSPRFAALPWDPRGLEEVHRRAGRAASASEQEDDAFNALRYATAGLGQPGHLSWKSVEFLSSVYARRPDWFDGHGAALRRAIRGKSLLGAAWGMPRLTASPALFARHVGEMLMRRGELEKAGAALEGARAASSDGGILLSSGIRKALSGDRGAARAELAAARSRGSAEAAVLADALGLPLDGGGPHDG